jgi:hypothetical protein
LGKAVDNFIEKKERIILIMIMKIINETKTKQNKNKTKKQIKTTSLPA